MPNTFQLIWLGITGVAGLVMLYVLIKRMLFPPTAVNEFGTLPGDRARIERAELVLRRGIRAVRWPTMFIVFVAVLVSDHVSSSRISVLVLGGGIVLSVVWYLVAVRTWWKWALRQDADPLVVEELTEDVNLVWRHESRMGRRARRTWMQLPPGRGAL